MDKNRFFFEHYGLTEHDLEHYLAAAFRQAETTPTFILSIFLRLR